MAQLDPLGINHADLDATEAPELQLSTYRFGNQNDTSSVLINVLDQSDSLHLALVPLTIP